MKAYQMAGFQQLPEFREVDVPEPRAGEVLIKVAGAGACHSDLHRLDGARVGSRCRSRSGTRTPVG